MLFQKRKRIKNLSLLLIGSFFISFLGVSIILNKNYDYQKSIKHDNELIEVFLEEQEEIKTTQYNFLTTNTSSKELYLGILEIPKINLKRGFYDKKSKKNTVSKNIEIIKESTMPNIEYGNLIIAGHCGNSKVAFFKNLPKLGNGDQAIIHYNGKQYVYELKNRYEIPKTGKANIIRNNKRTCLTLITCKHLTKKQIIFIFELTNII